MTTINEVIIGGNVGPEVLASTATGGFTLLVLGCVLITLSGILFAASVILFLKSKKLRQDAEVTMIRSTYDSVHFNTGSAPNYTSLDDLTQSPRRHPKLEKLDSDGYMVPSTYNPR
uniref:Uncharacterized protein LOC111130787 n=1 Tax=Crassostrea virginica TaxID=6565 RepID=A0A8B8DZN4_CRAVI|nr:uncharacterized protein LOC111130787 [Crassostrea virginica]